MLRLLRRWLHSRGTVSDDAYFWTLPEEVSPESWTFALINAWMQEILSVLQVQPPLGCSWSSHSLRSGGASAAFALGVDLLVIMNFVKLGPVVFPGLLAPLRGRAGTT